MNIQIITSSYPSFEGDPSGTAGLFIQSFANELISLGHKVIVQPVGRKTSYQSVSGIIIEPLPWLGRDQELASMKLLNPINWLIFLKFFFRGRKDVLAISQKYNIDRTLCMWIIPSGIFGYCLKKTRKKKYDVWALGSDVWKIRKMPFVGKYLIKRVVCNATNVFADGIKLAKDVHTITREKCLFLPSSRKLPRPNADSTPLKPENIDHLLFVGRYHRNKGPDLLLRALACLRIETKRKIQVHLFGSGPLENELRKLHGRLRLKDLVTIAGPIDAQNLSNYLERVAFLLIPSRIESIPVVFSDAIQRRVPVVTTPVGDMPELLEKHRCGILSDAVTPEAFAEALEEAVAVGPAYFRQGTYSAFKILNIQSSVQSWLNH